MRALPRAALTPVERRYTLEAVRRAAPLFPEPAYRSLPYDDAGTRSAATVVPIVDLDGEAAIVVTRRPSTMEYHRDEWVFPGGRIDPRVDGSAQAAAVRELVEELGVAPSGVEIVGRLDSHGPFSTGFEIEVFVAVLADVADLTPDEREVAEVRVVPLSALMADGAVREGALPEGHQPGPAVAPAPRAEGGPGIGPLLFFGLEPAARLEGERAEAAEPAELWGVQALVLWNLLENLVDARTE
jgi:8-oxo-dGTP pyrophosphatase MutT (NUDIX family)